MNPSSNKGLEIVIANLADATRAFQHIGSIVVPVVAELQKQLADFYRALDSLTAQVLQPLSEAMVHLSRTIATIDLSGIERGVATRLAHSLWQYGWWLVPGVDTELYYGIIDLATKGQGRSINRFICDWYGANNCRRLSTMVRRWDSNKYFQRRRQAYKQALWAHRRGTYYLTIPALLPLLEGIAKDYLQEEHGITEEGTRKAVITAVRQNPAFRPWREVELDALVRVLASTTYEKTDLLPEKTGLILNRHGILHGLYPRYGREANSLRCFLLLETLYHAITPQERVAET